MSQPPVTKAILPPQILQQIEKNWLQLEGEQGLYYRAFWNYCLKLRLGHAPYYRLIFSKIKNYSSADQILLHWEIFSRVLRQWDNKALESYNHYCLHKTNQYLQKPHQQEMQKIVSYWHCHYPQSLRDLFDPPLLIFYRGNLQKKANPAQKNPYWGCVGSRNPHQISEKDFEYFFRLWNEDQGGVPTIISGGARGIDTMSHQFAMRKCWPTWVVLGHGLQHVYPQENEFLYDSIVAAGGALITEYEAEVPPLKHHFVARNRIIAALAQLLIVAQAKQNSGSLITAQFALDLGREVIIWPPNLHEKEFVGSYDLIRQGASLMESCQQIGQY